MPTHLEVKFDIKVFVALGFLRNIIGLKEQQGIYKMSLESKKVLNTDTHTHTRCDEDMSKEHRSQLTELQVVIAKT